MTYGLKACSCHPLIKLCQEISVIDAEICNTSLTLISLIPQILCHMARWDNVCVFAKTNINQGKLDIIVERKVQALFRNKQKYKYDNHMQIMLMNIDDITI